MLWRNEEQSIQQTLNLDFLYIGNEVLNIKNAFSAGGDWDEMFAWRRRRGITAKSNNSDIAEVADRLMFRTRS